MHGSSLFLNPLDYTIPVVILPRSQTPFGNEEQIIINTHFPVLVGNLFKNHELDCKILYATLFSKVDPHKKQALIFTKMIPVIENLAQSPFDFVNITEQEQKITLSEVKKYLETKDFDQDFLAYTTNG